MSGLEWNLVRALKINIERGKTFLQWLADIQKWDKIQLILNGLRILGLINWMCVCALQRVINENVKSVTILQSYSWVKKRDATCSKEHSNPLDVTESTFVAQTAELINISIWMEINWIISWVGWYSMLIRWMIKQYKMKYTIFLLLFPQIVLKY